jgi:1-deoxy-D-xylulose-5-phosphate reductoisomerase
MESGGNAPCVLNAANEIAVELFLQDKISFLDMPELVAKALAHIPLDLDSSLEAYQAYDKETRQFLLNF